MMAHVSWRRITLLAVLILVSSASTLYAQNYAKLFTVTGVGGLSSPKAGVSTTPFWWIDTTGRTPGTDATAYGFQPFPAFQEALDDLVGGGAGSLLLSAPFKLKNGDQLVVNYWIIGQQNQWGDGPPPEGFALLLKDGAVVAVLENLTAEVGSGFYRFYDNSRTPQIPPEDCNFAPPSPGVTSTVSVGSGLDVTIGGNRYYVDGGPPLCGCFVNVSTAVTPGAGTYQLLFGLYDFVDDLPNFHAALVVKSVTRGRP